MASEGIVEASAPNLNLTAEEKRVYGQLFRAADSESVGVVTGEIAVKFFEKTRLDSRVLGEIWQIADKENRGFLTPAGFGVVLRLIGHAQAGREPTPELARQQGPIPRFDGLNLTPAPPPPPPAVLAAAATAASTLQAQGTGSSAGGSGPGGGPIRIPPLTPEKVAQYASIFERQPLQSGNMLPGEQAKQIFEKSGLPNEILGRIWMLADTEQRGALVLTEFVIAMHLLTSMKSGALRGLPNILPAALYEAATRRGPIPGSPLAPAATGAGPGLPRQQSPTIAPPPVSAIPRQITGQASLPQMRTGSPLNRPPMPTPMVPPPLAAQTTGDWLITPADKSRFDLLYEELDKTKKGFITGEEAVPFFSQSNLPEDVLAQIWDLADINSEGRLTRDLFAIAMYLIRQQRSKRDGPSMLPNTLPPNLIPPSMRNQVRAAPGAVPVVAPASAFDPVSPPRPQPKPSALDDLFGLDDPQPPAPAPAQAQAPMTTGAPAAINDPFASGAISPPAAPSSPMRPTATGSTFKPFMPSSSFGRGLTAQVTGGSNTSASSHAKPGGGAALSATAEDDLLGDHDPEVNKNISNETTELANLSNQIGSLTKQMQDVQGQRTKTQNELNQASVQKKNFEQRLAQLRAMYEKEASDVRSLETQLAASRNETKKLQAEIAMVEASHQDQQNQHRQLSTALQADQQENANLKERIRVVNAEIAQLKPQIEKLKSEARQQKGIVAINKKQLATNEAERDKLKTEVEDLARSNEELARQVSSSSSPVLTHMASPALSTASANNPFFRRTGSTDIGNTFASPPLRAFSDKTFDDVFGPMATGSGSQSGTPPPPSAASLFKPQNTGTSTASVGSFATPTSTTPGVSRQATMTGAPTGATERPASPESRMHNSGFLPFVDAAESLPSRQVSPPMGRANQTEESQSQTNPVALPVQSAPSGQSFASGSGSDASSKAAASPSENNRPTSNGISAPFGLGSPAGGADPNKAASAESDPFAAMDQAKPKDDFAKAKEDFESAFASFKSSNTKSTPTGSNASDTAKAFATFSSEFPPISELERDDDSDTESDGGGFGGGGFDDDFAPASPPPKVTAEKAGADTRSRSTSPTLTKSTPEVSAPGAATEAPAANEKPASPAPTSSPTKMNNNFGGHSVDDIFGSASAHSPQAASTTTSSTVAGTQPTLTAAPSAASKSAFDDLDDDFEGLEDAKEGSADDDFANISRSGLDDFNPVFDSSPPPSQPKSEQSATTSSPPFGVESSFDFGSLSTPSVTGSTSGGGAPLNNSNSSTAHHHQQQNHQLQSSQTGGGGAKNSSAAGGGQDSHDWDALFASLDETPTASNSPAPALDNNSRNGTTAKEQPPSASSPASTAQQPGGSSQRPSTGGRALTEEGEHDDPILKNLTSMGYSRTDALTALEKYDYNLERAANYLASQS